MTGQPHQDAIDKDLDKAVGDALTTFGASKVSLKPVPKQEMTLSQQWNKLSEIESELRDRIRREKIKLVTDFEHRAMTIKNEYAIKISEEIARLEKLRDRELADLSDRAQVQLREHELLTQRMS